MAYASPTTKRAQTAPRPARAALAFASVLFAPFCDMEAAQAAGSDDPVEVERVAFVEAAAERGFAWAGEALRVRVRLGIEREFLRDGLVQPFVRALEVPVQLEAPWLDGVVAGGRARRLAATPPAEPVAEIAVNDRLEAVSRLGTSERDGRTFEVFVAERTFVAPEAGELRLEAPVLRLAYATRFEEDLFDGRRALDRRDASVIGDELVVEVRALPGEPPPGFAGAVGQLALAATATPTALESGEAMRLELTIRATGACDLAAFTAPWPDGIEGFHSLGFVERTAGDARVLAFDLVPLAGTTGVPALALPFFNPSSGAFEIARSEAIPLSISGASEAEPAGPGDAGDSAPEAGDAEGRGLPTAALPLAGVAAALLGLLVLIGRARRER